MPNALAREKSPYLLQHANNPVEWLAWGEEAFRRAREEGKPVFLSVGYSTCHWCHVMERESFENDETARVMNEHFINVKVDREERPDVDLTYMAFVQATTGRGGWPMNVWLTPNLKPFLGGTYFPPEDREGRIGFPRVLNRVAELWATKRDELLEQGERVVNLLREQAEEAPLSEGEVPLESVFDIAAEQLKESFDTHFGGFNRAPKFPRPVLLNLLFRIHERAGAEGTSEGRGALTMAQETLQGMACGGIYDHLGGGFHRYSVDQFWHVPHFEKMLYDQAQLAVSYMEAFQVTGVESYRVVADKVLEYVLREMTSPEGGFYSAEDADSLLDESSKERAEGAFYVWRFDELESALGVDSMDLGIFAQLYGAEKDGNIRPESDPLGELKGKNVLYRVRSEGQVADEMRIDRKVVHASLNKSGGRLFKARMKRPRPHLDDKIITAWNGLMISAFARAHAAFGNETYRDAAVKAAEFVRNNLVNPEGGGLLRSYRDGPGEVPGFAPDYALMIQGLLDLYGAVLDVSWLRWAVDLQVKFDELYFDAARRGYLSVSEAAENSILSIKEDHDGAEPSPNSIGALNLLRLAELTGEKRWKEKAASIIDSVRHVLTGMPLGMPQMAVALDHLLAKPSQIVIAAGDDYGLKSGELLRVIRSSFRPKTTLILLDSDEAVAFFGETSPAIAEMKPRDGKTAVYVCEDFACRAPVTEPEELEEALGGGS